MQVGTKTKEDVIDLEVTTTDKIWRQIMAKDKSAAIAVLKQELQVKPRLTKLASFMAFFDTSS